MHKTNDIHIRKSGKAGRITLTRPDALNALTYDMCLSIEKALDEWRDDSTISLIIIDAEGSKSFCAGGDIADLYKTGKAGDFEFGRKFWADEYRVNAKIKNYSKPFVAIMDGIVMGGGVGISAHGSHRVVTENTLFAMPECGIGLAPDVGGNLLLSRAPGYVGEYLGTTGARLDASDCIYAGIADVYVPEAGLPELIEALEDTADLSFMDTFEKHCPPGKLSQTQAMIDGHFHLETAVDIIRSLENTEDEWASKTASLMRKGCPLSVASAVDMVRQARNLGLIEEILALEYRFTYRSMSHGDFIEGIRAQIIDKDRKPNWKIARLEDLSGSEVSQMLENLGDAELTF